MNAKKDELHGIKLNYQDGQRVKIPRTVIKRLHRNGIFLELELAVILTHSVHASGGRLPQCSGGRQCTSISS